MKRQLSPSIGQDAAKRRCARISFASFPMVYTVDCSLTTTDLFYNQDDIRSFRQDFLEEQDKAGSLQHLVIRKRRQKAMQRETVAEFMRKAKIERRIQEIIAVPATSSNTSWRMAAASGYHENSDICFHQRCIPVHHMSMLEQEKPKKKASIAHAA